MLQCTPMSFKTSTVIFGLILLGLVTFALIPKSQQANNQPVAPSPNLNNLAQTKNLDEFLSLAKPTADIVEAYRFAQENPLEVLSIVKCYCGCLENGAEHRNNRDCFINDDGTFDLMGLNCGLCIKTALLSKQMLADGKSVQEIANYVDNHWGNQFN